MTTTTVATKSVTLNGTSPEVLVSNINLDWTNVPVQAHKYVTLTHRSMSKLNWQAQVVINLMQEHLQGGFKSTLFDYKVAELTAGDCGCKLPEWHIDVTRNPNHDSREDVHLIYSTVVGTEFIFGSFESSVEDFAQVEIPSWHGVFRVPADSITRFRRSNLHRGPVVERACKRVVIRITQTDII